MLKNKKKYLILICIVILAFLLRFWNLGEIPISPDWDEASLGYNAYSILNTGKDEFGEKFPLILRSFGDYKPALYAYLIIPFIVLFDLTIFSVRLPSVILGTFSIFISYLLIKELFRSEKIALLTTLLFAISPWHIQFSRVAFEANLGLTLNLLAILLFIKGLSNKWFLIFSALFAGLGLHAYQSEKLFVPLMGFALVVIYRKELLLIPKKFIITSIIVGLLVVSPIIYQAFSNPETLSRAKGTSFMNNPVKILSNKHYDKVLANDLNNDYLGKIFDNRRVEYAKVISANYLSHFNINFLFVTGDLNERHHPPGMGHIYLIELLFILIGLYLLVFGTFSRKTKLFIFSWIIISPIPASLTWDVPNAVRLINILPIPHLLSAIGILGVIEFIKNKKGVRVINLVYLIIILGFMLNFAYFINQYFSQYNYFSASSWQYGYKELVKFSEENKNSYEKIVISRLEPLDQSYIFYLFYLKLSPEVFQEIWKNNSFNSEVISFDKYEFKNFYWNNENKENILYIGSRNQIPPEAKLKKIIYYPDGTEAIIVASEE